LLAMDVNDNARFLIQRVAFEFIVGSPPGASSLLQKSWVGPDQSMQAYTTSSTSISSRARPATTMAARLG
jgi:hypothetical protein